MAGTRSIKQAGSRSRQAILRPTGPARIGTNVTGSVMAGSAVSYISRFAHTLGCLRLLSRRPMIRAMAPLSSRLLLEFARDLQRARTFKELLEITLNEVRR